MVFSFIMAANRKEDFYYQQKYLSCINKKDTCICLRKFKQLNVKIQNSMFSPSFSQLLSLFAVKWACCQLSLSFQIMFLLNHGILIILDELPQIIRTSWREIGPIFTHILLFLCPHNLNCIQVRRTTRLVF